MSEGKLRLAFGTQDELAALEADLISGKITHAEAHKKLKLCLEYARDNMAWCIEHMEDDKRAAIVCSKIAGVAGRLLHNYVPVEELLHWREAGMKAARLCNAVDEEIAHLNSLAFLHFSHNNISTALELSAQAVDLARQMNDGDVVATTLQTQAVILSQTGSVDTAIEKLKEAEAIYQQSGNRSGQAKVLSAHALCLSSLGNSNGAVSLLRQAILLETDAVARGTYQANIADQLIGSENLTEAWDAISVADEIATSTRNKTLIGLVNLRWARWKALQDDEESHKQTVRHLEIAFDNFSEMNAAYHLQQTLQMQEQTFVALVNPEYDYYSAETMSVGMRGLCSVLYIQGRFEESLHVSKELHALGIQMENTQDQVAGAISAGRCALMLKDPGTAIEYANIGRNMVSAARLTAGPTSYSDEATEVESLLLQANALKKLIELPE